MTLLSRKVDYALLILAYLHQRSEGGNAREVAERYHLSRPFVANILKELVHHGFVSSHRGVKGGYALAKAPREISLADVIESLEDGFQLAVCNTSGPDHPVCGLESMCPIKEPLHGIHQRLISVMRSVSLADMWDCQHPSTNPSSMVLTPLNIRDSKMTPA